MPVIPKIAGSVSILSSLNDIHKTAMIYSGQERKKAMGDTVVACSIGNQKANNVSYKDAQRKNWINSKNFFSGTCEIAASAKGYFKGAAQGIARYLPKLALALAAIIPSKSKILAYTSTILLAGAEIWDFLVNGTGLFEEKNYLKRK